MMKRISILVTMFAISCGGGGDDPPAIDAPGGGNIDAAAATVVEVTPCTGETATVESTGGFRFMPMAVTINQGQIVKFENRSDHDVAPLAPMTDSGLRVGFGATKCLRFTQAGTFNYKCTPHGFTGSITVN